MKRVSPIIHDSDEWRGLQDKLTALIAGQAILHAEMEGLKGQQSYQHQDNQQKIDTINMEVNKLDLIINGHEDSPGLKTQMAILIAYGKATTMWIKISAGLLTLLIGGGTWYATLHH